MEEQLLTKSELAIRWKVSEKTIDKWRKEGIINTVKGIPFIRFNLTHIRELEDTPLEYFSPLERKRLEIKLDIVTKERDELKKCLRNILSESLKVLD